MADLENPDFGPMPDEGQDRRKPVSVLFADMSGSVSMYAARGDAVAFKLNSTLLSLMERQVKGVSGQVIRCVGDGILALFDHSVDAVKAAANVLGEIDSNDSTLNREGIRVRAGISSGPVVLGGTDIYGDIVNIAARLAALARPSEILLSGSAFEELPEDVRRSARLIDKLQLRGRPEPVLVYQYLWKPDDMTVAYRARPKTALTTLEVTFRDKVFIVGIDRPRLTLGRAADNDVSVQSDTVSRYHATITHRGDQFVLTDSSTNGTFVETANRSTSRLLREDFSLLGSGRIHLGGEASEPITFRIARGK